MKLFTTTAFLAVAGGVFAMPKPEIKERGTCTFFGYTFACNWPTVTTKTSTMTMTTTTSTSVTAAAYTNIPVTTTTTPMATKTPVAATSIPVTTTTTPIAAKTPVAATNIPASTAVSTSSSPSTGGKSGYTGGSTASDIDNDSGCTALTVVFARGTSESGNVGTVSGPPMFKQLLSDRGASSLTLQGVNYPASSAGNANCGADGGADMANEVKAILARCPNTKIALSGYSQGACVVHNAVASQGLDNSKISAVVLFGDPFNGQQVGSVPSSKVLEICASGDHVCDGSGTFQITSAHLTYGNNAAQAASFIESASGV